MKKSICRLLFLSTCLVFSVAPLRAQPHAFGFGLILGEPLGGTLKVWTNPVNAFVFDIGDSYFGSPRVDADYLWHFNAFRSNVVFLYAGPGLALGFGTGDVVLYDQRNDRFYYRTDGSIGIGARVIFGLDVIPRSTPFEFFVEAGPLIGISPGFGSSIRCRYWNQILSLSPEAKNGLRLKYAA